MKEDIFMKLLSARFWLTLMLTGTFCYGFAKGIVPTEVFAPAVILSIDWYFKRERNKDAA